MLKLGNLRTDKIKHGLFGGVEMSENRNRYLLNLSSLDGKHNYQIEALDQTKICSSLPMIRNKKFIKVLENKGIYISDVRQHGDRFLYEENLEEIHLLLGVDTEACLFTERIEHFPGHEIAAFETKKSTCWSQHINDSARRKFLDTEVKEKHQKYQQKMCFKCKRFNVPRIETQAGMPPEDRVRDGAIFEVVGVDLSGPLHLADGSKSWIVTCNLIE
ncbi:DUF1758 domain-containing protein [Nephila pilipes]|uniref:DUF1758 domain-containing protein n=1 Tax=Nephila pilipes TaxID=299642 RepID=A0A8X6R5Q1_NEPPI|nr:DUF1758 domain-containing protein [Nephila pilipes]